MNRLGIILFNQKKKKEKKKKRKRGLGVILGLVGMEYISRIISMSKPYH